MEEGVGNLRDLRILYGPGQDIAQTVLLVAVDLVSVPELDL
jgi:hypothetical protein